MLMNTILTMSSIIFPIITFPYISRILLPEGMGKVSFATSTIAYFSIFAQLGIPTYGVRACARVRNDKMELSRTVQEIMLINLVTCIIAYLLFLGALLVVPRLHEENLLMVVISSTIIFNAMGVEWMYRALEEYQYITMRSILFKLIALIAMFLFVHQKSDYLAYGAISILATSASNICNFVYMRKFIIFRPVGGYDLREHLRPIMIFFLMSVATVIYGHLDTIMLGFMKTDEVVGYYNAAVKIKGILVSVVTSVSAVLLPRASYYVDKGMIDEFYRSLKKTLNFILLVAPAMMLYFMIYAEEGVSFLSGDAYAQAVLPMQIIMPTLVFIGITNVLGIQMMIPLGMEKSVLYSEIAGAITNLVLNAILIPFYGVSGAAIGTLVAEGVVMIWQYHAARKVSKTLFKQIQCKKIMCALIAAVIASIWVKKLPLIPFLTLAVSAVCFFGVYGIILFIIKEKLMLELMQQMQNKIHRRIKKIL